MRRKSPEHDEQARLVRLLRSRGVLFFAVPNGVRLRPRQAAWLKAEGMEGGVPDLMVLPPAPSSVGVSVLGVEDMAEVEAAWGSLPSESLERRALETLKALRMVPLEMKAPKPKGRVSATQRVWLDAFEERGFPSTVAYGADEAVEALTALGVL